MTTGFKERLEGKALRTYAAALLCCVLAGCASAPGPAQVANDPKNGDGIGGTGIRTAQIKNGDGVGGTGILGTISGFGSILVNGLKLEFDPSTVVADDGKPSSLEALKVGQVVLGTARSKDSRLYLEKLDIQHAVAGPITAIDHTAETMTVLGQKVKLNLGGDTAAMDAFKSLKAGDLVTVSGLRWADGTIIATRVDEQPRDGRVLLRGPATAVTATTVRIGDQEIPLADAVVGAPVIGGQVFASGRMINGRFAPDVITGSAPLPFDKDVNSVSLEAYAPKAAGTGGSVTVQGITVDGAALPPGTATNDRVVITGRIASPDRITATGIEKIRTMVTIHTLRSSMRPAEMRPDAPSRRPERVAPPERPQVPQVVKPEIPKPEIPKPEIERPQDLSRPIA